MTSATMKYSLRQFNDLSNSNFHYEIPTDVFEKINALCLKVHAPIISNKVFQKNTNNQTNTNDNNDEHNTQQRNRKKRGNKSMEVSEAEWETIRTFQTTKIEQKSGIEADLNEIRLYLNKLTDKTFMDIREKIIDKINLVSNNISDKEDFTKLGNMLYEQCSTNKFYSKIFADLFAELATSYSWLKKILKMNRDNIMNIYNDIKYVDSETDYDGFCDMNKKNERRRAITTFYLNLGMNGYVKKKYIVKLLRDILEIIMNFIDVSDKKNEVDELTEIVAILYDKEIIELVEDDADDVNEYYVNDESIINIVSKLAQSKVKDHPSLSNKAIFKYMDLVDM